MSIYRYLADGSRREIVGDELAAWEAEQAVRTTEIAVARVDLARDLKLAQIREAAIARVIASEYGVTLAAIETVTKDARLSPEQKRLAIEAIEVVK